MPWMHLLLAATAVLLLACGSSPETTDVSASLRVFVSILPHAGVAERLGGDRVEAEVLVPAGQSPATYEPSLRQMDRLGESEAWFRVGVAFERSLVDRVERRFPELEVVDLRQGITLRSLPRHNHGSHAPQGHDSHGSTSDKATAGHHREPHYGHASPTASDPEHANGAFDPHTWLAPPLMEQQARLMARTLGRLDPAGNDRYEAHLQDFLGELRQVHQELEQILAPLEGSTFLVFHPAYGYFGQTYGLEQRAVELEGKQPTAAELDEAIAWARAHDIEVVFVQPQFSRAQAEVVAQAIDGVVVELDPLAPNYLENLRTMAHRMRSALGPDSESSSP